MLRDLINRIRNSHNFDYYLVACVCALVLSLVAVIGVISSRIWEDTPNVEGIIIVLINMLLATFGLNIFSMSRNRIHRLCTFVITFVAFGGADIYFSINLLSALPPQEKLLWFYIGIAFIAAYVVCAIQSVSFHSAFIRHTFNETRPRLPNIQLKAQTQVILIALLCFCVILIPENPIFIKIASLVLYVTWPGLHVLKIHRHECWLADRLVRVLDVLRDRPFLHCLCLLISNTIRETSVDADTTAADTSKTNDLENIKVPMDVLYIGRMDIPLITEAYAILFFREIFLLVVYKEWLYGPDYWTR